MQGRQPVWSSGPLLRPDLWSMGFPFPKNSELKCWASGLHGKKVYELNLKLRFASVVFQSMLSVWFDSEITWLGTREDVSENLFSQFQKRGLTELQIKIAINCYWQFESSSKAISIDARWHQLLISSLFSPFCKWDWRNLKRREASETSRTRTTVSPDFNAHLEIQVGPSRSYGGYHKLSFTRYHSVPASVRIFVILIYMYMYIISATDPCFD